METNNSPLENISKNNPFIAPEGYFENLTNQIMTSLPEKGEKPSVRKTIWQKTSPWVYLAAMITGIAFGIGLFVKQDIAKDDSLMLAEQDEIEYHESLLASGETAEDVLLSAISEYELYEYLVEKDNQLEEGEQVFLQKEMKEKEMADK